MKEMNDPNQVEAKASGIEKPEKKGNTKEQALELMSNIGIDCIYYTTDGYWFTQKALANEHAKGAKTDVKEFKK